MLATKFLAALLLLCVSVHAVGATATTTHLPLLNRYFGQHGMLSAEVQATLYRTQLEADGHKFLKQNNTGHCCDIANAPSCNIGDKSVAAVVCLVDSYCCATAWDHWCVAQYAYFSANLNQVGCPGATYSNCCIADTGLEGGCADSACVAAVAGERGSCGDSWDSHCVSLALSLCPSLCDGILPPHDDRVYSKCLNSPSPRQDEDLNLGMLGVPVGSKVEDFVVWLHYSSVTTRQRFRLMGGNLGVFFLSFSFCPGVSPSTFPEKDFSLIFYNHSQSMPQSEFCSLLDGLVAIGAKTMIGRIQPFSALTSLRGRDISGITWILQTHSFFAIEDELDLKYNAVCIGAKIAETANGNGNGNGNGDGNGDGDGDGEPSELDDFTRVMTLVIFLLALLKWTNVHFFFYSIRRRIQTARSSWARKGFSNSPYVNFPVFWATFRGERLYLVYFILLEFALVTWVSMLALIVPTTATFGQLLGLLIVVVVSHFIARGTGIWTKWFFGLDTWRWMLWIFALIRIAIAFTVAVLLIIWAVNNELNVNEWWEILVFYVAIFIEVFAGYMILLPVDRKPEKPED